MSPLGHPQELQTIIDDRLLNPVFQPIVDIQQPMIYGYEALIRGPVESALHAPLALFDTASRYSMMAPLERACREVACHAFAKLSAPGKLFLNMSPMSLTEERDFSRLGQRMIESLGVPSQHIVIELSEQYPLHDYGLLREAIDAIRGAGFEIAIDDLGAGYAGLRAWSELRPDYVKIDRHFIEDIHSDSVKREFVRSIKDIAQELDCAVIAEGIETAEDLAVVQDIGLQYGQGFYIGRPEKRLEPVAAVLQRARPLSQGLGVRQLPRIGQRIGDIAQTSISVHSATKLDDVGDLFQDNRELSCIPVVDDQLPVGLVDRQEILELFSQRYSRELHGRKAIKNFMNQSPVVVPDSASLEEVSRLLTNRADGRMALDFVVTRDGRYFGIGRTSTLLKRITDQQIRNARYANPLTLLPGNVPLYEQLEEQLKSSSDFHVAYFDLNYFKPFNDHYGYSKGDEVIIALSKILLDRVGEAEDFLAHIGGDDFVVVFRSADWRERCQAILSDFAASIGRYYCASAIDEGGIWGVNRAGDKQFFKLLSLSVGVVHPDARYCRSFHDIAALAMDAKKQAKQNEGNFLFYSRRRRPTDSHSHYAQATSKTA